MVSPEQQQPASPPFAAQGPPQGTGALPRSFANLQISRGAATPPGAPPARRASASSGTHAPFPNRAQPPSPLPRMSIAAAGTTFRPAASSPSPAWAWRATSRSGVGRPARARR
ncbi:hypothetical protein BAE44_0014948 [Dichanthelium oligosanthes]|uniref:Uncharacterized protein n=1 Tax=Dichanthelium oligosanthes TaxID=888268 RepID=A0A1E5VFX7_9POAL|nr:hypothetical protein BAE44_0014948 [Dichanthelium oligosanthes]